MRLRRLRPAPRVLLRAALLVAALVAPAAAETVELVPEGGKYWGARNLFAPFTSLFLGPRYWYGDRVLEIETTPADAQLDLFYVRGGFQKAYEQADAPATVVLPRRIDAGPRDVIKVRAFSEGYRYGEVTVKVSARQSRLQIDLDPLPNALEAVTHTYFGGRATLTFLTREALTLKLQDRGEGINVALTQTARRPESAAALAAVRDPIVADVESLQLGEDLLVRITYSSEAQAAKPEVRSRQGRDPLRNFHVYSLDLVEPGSPERSVERARKALARVRREDLTGCAAEFDAALRAALDPAALARALTPQGRFADPYLRAAMRRLGELSADGVVRLRDGTAYDPAVPLQLAAAQSQAGEVRGYLALLRRFAALLEAPPHREAVLRSLVAPELSPGEFGAALREAEARERACRARLAAR